MRSLITMLCGLLLVAAAFAMDADFKPQIGPTIAYPPVDDPWDLLEYADVQTLTGDNQLLGIAQGNMVYCISGGYSAGTNQLYVFDQNWVLVRQFDQWSSTGWGWRDLCFDGEYFYGSDDYVVDCFDEYGVAYPAMNINGPTSPCRALAYDHITDTFWTQSFGGLMYNFDRAGAVLWSLASTTGAHGFAWNEECNQMYIFERTGNPATTVLEFDYGLTGWSTQIGLLPGLTDQGAGGFSWVHDWSSFFGVPAYVGLVHGIPNDMSFIVEANVECSTPVVLSAFTASVVPEGVALQWKTASELDCYGWYVQRDEVDISPLIEGYGTTEEPHEYAYTDPVSEGTYTYCLKQVDIGGAVTLSNPITVTVGAAEVAEYRLAQNFPNPFNPITNISFSLKSSGHVVLSVFDVSGREVANLINGYREAGTHEVTFDAMNLASGVYVYRLKAGDFAQTQKMVLVK